MEGFLKVFLGGNNTTCNAQALCDNYHFELKNYQFCSTSHNFVAIFLTLNYTVASHSLYLWEIDSGNQLETFEERVIYNSIYV